MLYFTKTIFYFNYIRINNSIPIVNNTDTNDFILLSFYKQKMKDNNKHLKVDSCQQDQNFTVPYGFYCKIFNWDNINGILFFDDQCVLIKKTDSDCFKNLIKNIRFGDRNKVQEFFQEKKKKQQCGFESATYTHQLIDDRTKTDQNYFE